MGEYADDYLDSMLDDMVDNPPRFRRRTVWEQVKQEAINRHREAQRAAMDDVIANGLDLSYLKPKG